MDKVEKFLATLVNLKGDSISWSSSNPNNDAYQIRQGLAIAEKTKHPEFKDLKRNFRISVKNGQVIASRIISIVDTEGVVLNSENFVKSVSVFEIKEVTDAMSVIGALITYPNYEEYHFPDFIEPSEAQLTRLFRWTDKNSFFIVKSSFLIVTKKEPPEGIAWKANLKIV